MSEKLLYLVTDTVLCGGFDGVVATARAAAENGADIVQVRDHQATTRDLVTLTERVRDAVRPFGALCVVDDRLDVALAAGADGVHLGQSDLDPRSARMLAAKVADGPFHIGWSVSSVEHVRAAAEFARGTVDLVGIGPFRDTPTKPDAAPAIGLAGVGELADLAWESGLPNVVIGGVKLPDVPDLLTQGAGGIAVVSAICGQADPGVATRSLRVALDQEQ